MPASWIVWTRSRSVPPSHVLVLLGLAQRRLVGALDADEDADDVRLDHQLHQLVVLGQVERRLGEEGERDSRAPRCQATTARAAALMAFLLPIKLSSTMKTISMPLSAQRLELGDDLRRRS